MNPLKDIDLTQVLDHQTWTMPGGTLSSKPTLTMADLLRTKRILQAQDKRHWTGHEKAAWIAEFPDGPYPWERIEVRITVTVQPFVDALQAMSESFAKAVTEMTAMTSTLRR